MTQTTIPAKKAIPAIGPATAPAIHAWLGGEGSGFSLDESSVDEDSVDLACVGRASEGEGSDGLASVGLEVSLVVDVVEAGDAGWGFDFVVDSEDSIED